MNTTVSNTFDTEAAVKNLGTAAEIEKLSEELVRSPIRTQPWNVLALLSFLGLSLVFTHTGHNVAAMFVGLIGLFNFFMNLHNETMARVKKLADLLAKNLQPSTT